jgi:putative cardiolipin synthase
MIRKDWEGDPMAGLHTKALVFDRESVFIGSFNLDPRSAVLNTEAGLYVESPELAEQVLSFMDEGVLAANSYHVQLDTDGDLYWETVIDGVTVRYDDEPETTFWQRFHSDFIQLLPVESQL